MNQAEIIVVPFEDIQVNAHGLRNPRHRLDGIEELKSSIVENGLQYPCTVWEYTDPESGETRYVLAAGFRRHSAISHIREETPDAFGMFSVVVLRGSLEQALAKNLEENIQRSNLNPADEIIAVFNLYERVGDQTEVGRMVGKSQSWVSQKVSLKKRLIPRALSALRTEQINLPQAKRIAELTNEDGTPHEEYQNAVLDRLLNTDDDTIPEPTTPRAKTHRTKKEVEDLKENIEAWLRDAVEDHHRDRAFTMESMVEWLQCDLEIRDLAFLVHPSLEVEEAA